MVELEKVKRGLEAHSRPTCETCDGQECPYYRINHEHNNVFSCSVFLASDALDLLNQQDNGIEPIESTAEQKKFADRIGFAVSEFWCGACHFNLIGRPKFCPNCGKKVKWVV